MRLSVTPPKATYVLHSVPLLSRDNTAISRRFGARAQSLFWRRLAFVSAQPSGSSGQRGSRPAKQTKRKGTLMKKILLPTLAAILFAGVTTAYAAEATGKIKSMDTAK